MTKMDAPFTNESPRPAEDDLSSGTDSDLSGDALAAVGKEQGTRDFFKVRNGVRFAGAHLIVDLWGCSGIESLALVEQALRDSVTAAGATLLGIHLHHFTENDGVSGVAVLAESHISIHTWPEAGFAALDIFMCGAADPQLTVPVLERAFTPSKISVKEILRGQGL